MTNLKLGKYRHYKGNMYQVVGFARHSETLEELVVYQALQGNFEMWTRPLIMFTDNLIYEGCEVERFTYQSETFTSIHELKN